jgi:hypothetical protein
MISANSVKMKFSSSLKWTTTNVAKSPFFAALVSCDRKLSTRSKRAQLKHSRGTKRLELCTIALCFHLTCHYRVRFCIGAGPQVGVQVDDGAVAGQHTMDLRSLFCALRALGLSRTRKKGETMGFAFVPRGAVTPSDTSIMSGFKN